MSSYAWQQVLLNLNSDIRAILDFICAPSNKLANRGIYLARQLYFKTGRTRNKAKLHRLLKSNSHFRALYSHTAQQTLTAVAQSFSSFLALVNAWHSGKIPDTPKLPNYKRKSLSEQYGLRFVETEESYTCLFCGWGLPNLQSVKKTQVGVQKAEGLMVQNLYLNADCNGAANILRKTTLGLCLKGVSRGALVQSPAFRYGVY